ncbi:MAG: hypothetical protein SVV67_02960 [Bacillota bacterium]|nr:hypothetical protein [Bacillota bacterium]
MFLKEFAVSRYGPLPESGRLILSSFNLFYGPNEDGKTLTLDALLKMLLGKKAQRHFTRLKRVEELPEGYLLLIDGKGLHLKLPAEGTLEDHFKFNAREFGSIFVIRDSDLLISGEGDFFRDLTGRLTGMRTEEIKKLKLQINELGRITETGVFVNTAPEKLKDKLNTARSLMAKTENLAAALQEEGFGCFEEELAALQERRRKLTKSLKDLNDADKRDLYERGSTALAGLAESQEEYRRLQYVNRDVYETWQQAASRLDYYSTELKNIETKIVELKKELQSAHIRLLEKNRLVREEEIKLTKTEEKLQPLLDNHEKQSVDLKKFETAAGAKNLRFCAAFAAAVFLLLLAVISPGAEWWQKALLIFSGVVVTVFGLLQALFLIKRTNLAATETEIIIEGEKKGLPASSVGEIRAGLACCKDSFSRSVSLADEMVKVIEWKEKEINRLESDGEEKKRFLAGIAQKTKTIRRQSGADSLDQYGALLRRKEDLSLEIEKQKSLLAGYFGGRENPAGSSQISFWQRQVNKLAEYAGSVPHIDCNPAEVVRLEAERDKLDREIENLQERMGRHLEKMRDFEREINEFFQGGEGEEYLYCQTVVDLESIQKKLRCWIDRHEKGRDTALKALEILDRLADEEEDKVASLFGPASAAGRYFARITGGNYRHVSYDSRENMIRVHLPDDSMLEADRLSGGTFDQLYFAIRLALGEKILEGEKGFFLLDDPFVKADPERLSTLLEMLFEINDAGWQILYFSAKEEIKRALQEKIDCRLIKEFSINRQAP